ncbi:MAG: SMC-Scp complex subunit ScpB [Planctomycetes bacterium]|nr:SMC-Scp complex subunit ScpB [Planctomycetota bacterium]MBI3846789.1 SMC-Scp complex subunit ScpB [Planctomycetota bacterium]
MSRSREKGEPESKNDEPQPAAAPASDEPHTEAAPESGVAVEAQESSPPAEAPARPALRSAVEAALFATAEPLTADRIAKAITGVDKRRVVAEIEALREEYRAQNRAFDVEEVAGGFHLRTRVDHAPVVERLVIERREERLTTAAIETLAIIAYKQPISRAEIEAIRGVQSSTLIRTLLDRGLVRITGRAEVLGRPLLYGTTTAFLERFGLKSPRDLPRRDDFPAPKE